MALCQCCEEREVHPLCDPYCAECAKPGACEGPHCGHQLSEDDVAEWTPESQEREGGWLCESCRNRNAKCDWLDETCKTVESLAAEHEWEFGRWHYAETGSRYVELNRECDSCILGSDGDCTCETLTVRVSDHGSAYCSEDYSIAMKPSGDDHTLEILAARLACREAK